MTSAATKLGSFPVLTLTRCMALLRGMVATLAVEGALDAPCFYVYTERVLGPRLWRGDMMVLDKLGTHRAGRIEEIAESRGAQVLWLAPSNKADCRLGRCSNYPET